MKKKVLVVDDDAVVREAVKDTLAGAFTVYECKDGHDAIDVAVTHQVDLILLDIMMPGFDGLATLLLLKHTPEAADIPVIMLTAVGKKEKVIEAKREGAAAYVLKPFTRETLMAQVKKILGQTSK